MRSHKLPLVELDTCSPPCAFLPTGGRDPIFILLNGALGIGKTTTARALLEKVPGARLYNPEPVGVGLQRLSALLRPGARIDDFQNLASWRRITAFRARWRHRNRAVMIVPMAFSNLTYLDTLAGTLAGFGISHKLCLVAPLEVVRERLQRRAEVEGMPVNQWVLKRAETCCEAHRSPAFRHPIDATTSTGEIVRSICELTALQ